MEVNPFECPICMCLYSHENTPTTLPCGHSICLSHTVLLQDCCLCRRKIPAGFVCEPTFALLDGALWYAKLSTKQPNPDPNEGSMKGVFSREMVGATDEEFARLLYFELNGCFPGEDEHKSIQPPPPPPPPLPSNIRVEENQRRKKGLYGRLCGLIQTTPTVKSSGTPQSNTQRKSCGHDCSFSSLDRCCACMDRRSVLPEGTYPRYVDGNGWRNTGRRNEGYCPICKSIRPGLIFDEF